MKKVFHTIFTINRCKGRGSAGISKIEMILSSRSEFHSIPCGGNEEWGLGIDEQAASTQARVGSGTEAEEFFGLQNLPIQLNLATVVQCGFCFFQ